MGKPSADEQKPHTRPTEWNELAQHSKIPSFSSGGKWGGWVAEVFAITWGDLSGFASRESGERPAWKHVG